MDIMNLSFLKQVHGGKKYIAGVGDYCIFYAHKLRSSGDESSLKELDKDGNFINELYNKIPCHRTFDVYFNPDYTGVYLTDGTISPVTFHSTFEEAKATSPSYYAKKTKVIKTGQEADEKKAAKKAAKKEEAIPAELTKDEKDFFAVYHKVMQGVAKLMQKDTLTDEEKEKMDKGETWLKKSVQDAMSNFGYSEDVFFQRYSAFVEAFKLAIAEAAEAKKQAAKTK